MSYQKIVLISPSYDIGPYAVADHPPAGLGYLAEALEANGVDYIVIDQRLGYSRKELLAKIAAYRPDLIGVSMMTYLHQNTYETIKQIKKAFHRTDIIVGGPHVSTFRETVLKQCNEISYGAVLEGEETLVELCRGKPLEEIGGLIYRKRNEIRFNGERPFQRLENVAVPRFRKFELDKYLTETIPLVTSRGCPYNCIYCPVEKAIGKRFRLRSAQHVIDEITFWHNRDRNSYLILDDNFTLKPSRVEEICDLVEKNNLKDIDLALPNGIRADRVNRELLERMRQVGFSKLAFGVEAGNDKVLSNINKGEKLAQIEQAVKDACELGFQVILFFLIGSPGEKWSDFMDSIALAKRYPVDEVKFYNLIPFPGTNLYEWVKENHYFVRSPSEYFNSASHFINSPCFATPDLNLKERKKAFKIAQKTSRQIRRRSLKRRFKHLGLLSPVAALLSATRITQWIIQKSKLSKRFIKALSGAKKLT